MSVFNDFVPINPGELELGQPAPFDCFGENKALMLKRGTIVKSTHLEKLVGIGFKVDDAPVSIESNATPFDRMDDFKGRLQKIFTDFYAKDRPNNLSTRILKLSSDIQSLCKADLAAVLGAMHLNNTGRHSINHPLHLAIICEMVADAKSIPQEDRIPIIAAAITCNIGMLKIQDGFQRQDTPLSKDQKSDVVAHPLRSVALLMDSGIDNQTWLRTVKFHHERLDGKGYPASLVGEDIALSDRILRLADTYCSMIASRNYRSHMTPQEALRLILLKRSNEIDITLAQTLVKRIGVYPPGAFVKLVNGEKGIVVRPGESPSTPIVKCFAAANGVQYKSLVTRDCSKQDFAIKEMITRDKEFLVKLEELWDCST